MAYQTGGLVPSSRIGAGAGASLESGAGDPPILEVENIDKWFGGTRALRTVSLRVAAGEVHAIVGENGAGKSTLVSVIAGAIPHGSFDGQVRIRGRLQVFGGVRDAEKAGVFMVPQALSVVPSLTVAENLFLGREQKSRLGLDWRAMFVASKRWLGTFQLQDVQPDSLMGELSTGRQQMVSIARSMMQGLQILILDEPTAGLTEHETRLLFRQINELQRVGVSTLYISHRLGEVARIADRVTILRDGRVVDQVESDGGLATSRRLIRAMIGRDVAQLHPKTSAAIGDLILEVEHLSVSHTNQGRPPVVRDVSIFLHKGEILGLFGTIGSGTTAVGRALFGAWPGESTAVIRIGSHNVRIRSPQNAIDVGIAFASADRREELIYGMSVASNTSLVTLRRFSRLQIINPLRELQATRSYIKALRIAGTPEQPVGELSGGTQQKVVLAKWLGADPSIFVLEEPTQGVDIGAKIEIYQLIGDLVRTGKAVLLVSSDLQEVLGLADRVMVMRSGTVVASWARSETTEEEVLHAATADPNGE